MKEQKSRKPAKGGGRGKRARPSVRKPNHHQAPRGGRRCASGAAS